MPIYKNQNKVIGLYRFGAPVKEAYKAGALVYSSASEANIVTTGRDLTLRSPIVIYTTRYVRKYKPSGDPEETTTTGKEPLAKEVTIPVAKENYHDSQHSEDYSHSTYIGYAPRLEVNTDTYPAGVFYSNVYGGYGYVSQTEGSSTYQAVGGTLWMGSSLYDTNTETTSQFNVCDFGYIHLRGGSGYGTTSPGTWDVQYRTLKIGFSWSYSDGYNSSMYIKEFGIKDNTSGETVYTLNINKQLQGNYYSSSSDVNLSYNVNMPQLEIVSGHNYAPYITYGPSALRSSCTCGATLSDMRVRRRTVLTDYHYDEQMVLEAERMIDDMTYENEDGEIEYEQHMDDLMLSLTPASEYDPLTGHGVGYVQVSESGDVYNIVEFA